jgi:hypothetical protein
MAKVSWRISLAKWRKYQLMSANESWREIISAQYQWRNVNVALWKASIENGESAGKLNMYQSVMA